ncbi:MAG: agmatinase [Sphaerobacter sp.]|nr:agmatinase [Sphaerobacter sp.]
MPVRTIPVPLGQPSFADLPRCESLDALEADVAIIGVPYGVPYDMAGAAPPSSLAPAAVRAASLRFAPYLHHYDIDFGGELLAGRTVRMVDCGDVAMAPGQFRDNQRATEAAVRAILDRGAVPIVLGGDDAIPIPVLRAYDGYGPICVVQVDAHLDWRDEVHGVREGFSSTMRRASEMPWVGGMYQIGLRGVGSARRQEVEDARAYGSVLVPAAEVHRRGIDWALAQLPAAARYFITVDLDGFDPSIAPGVSYPAFGGLTYVQVFELVRAVAARGRIVGCSVVELQPPVDVRNLTSLLAARLILTVVGAMAHAGQIGAA